MTTLRFSINQRTSRDLAEAAKEKILETVLERARKNFGVIKPKVADVVDDVITDRKYLFQPTDREAFELGIGAGGSVDESKRSGAWESLLVSSGRGVTKITSRKGEGKTGIGNIQVHINYLRFYEQPECHVYDEDLDLPWMLWMIEGGEVLDHSFFSTTRSRVSRTGGGIMIKGGLWNFRPQSYLINDLQVGISVAVNAFITRFVAEELTR